MPARGLDLWVIVQALRLVNVLPASVCRVITQLSTKTVRLHDTITVKDYTTLQTAGS